jgi:hypothetical protein
MRKGEKEKGRRGSAEISRSRGLLEQSTIPLIVKNKDLHESVNAPKYAIKN